MNLELYMSSRYVSGGRTAPNLDCWGLVRLAYRDVHGVDLPLLGGLDASSLINKSKHYARLSDILVRSAPQHGAIAAVVTGRACEHVGFCVLLGTALLVLDTNAETGPRMIPYEAFVKERGNVECYTFA